MSSSNNSQGAGRALPPAQPPPHFPDPVLMRARRIPGFVLTPPDEQDDNTDLLKNFRGSFLTNTKTKTSSDNNESAAAMDTTTATNAMDEDTKPSLERRQSLAGNILLVEPDPTASTTASQSSTTNTTNTTSSTTGGTSSVLQSSDHPPKSAFMLQRKIRKSRLGTVRVGYGLHQGPEESESGGGGTWQVVHSAGIYNYEMYAIHMQFKYPKQYHEQQQHQNSLLDSSSHHHHHESGDAKTTAANKEDSNNKDGNTTTSDHHHDDQDYDRLLAAATTEQAALQWVATHDPEGKGHVLGTNMVAADANHYYTITPLHREGTLLDVVSAQPHGRLSETQARFFFKQILQGLETLKRIEICHRSLSLDSVLLRGHSCTLGHLENALRIPIDSESGMVHLLEPQPMISDIGQAPAYMAPELFRNQPFDGYAVDLWAASIMLFVMLLGTEPLFAAPVPEDRRFKEICMHRHLRDVVARFHQQQQPEKQESKQEEADTVPQPQSSPPIPGDEALDLLQSLLLIEARDRLTLAGVLEHPWVTATDGGGSEPPMDDHHMMVDGSERGGGKSTTTTTTTTSA